MPCPLFAVGDDVNGAVDQVDKAVIVDHFVVENCVGFQRVVFTGEEREGERRLGLIMFAALWADCYSISKPYAIAR